MGMKCWRLHYFKGWSGWVGLTEKATFVQRLGGGEDVRRAGVWGNFLKEEMASMETLRQE